MHGLIAMKTAIFCRKQQIGSPVFERANAEIVIFRKKIGNAMEKKEGEMAF